MTKSKFDTKAIIEFLEAYFNSIKTIVAHTIPKIVMTGIVREIEKTSLTFLLHHIVKDDKINLLKQDEEVEKQRFYYTDLRNRVLTIKNNFVKLNK